MLNYIKNLYKGRIGRQNWILGFLLLSFLFYLIVSVLGENNSDFGNLLIFILFIIYFIYYSALIVRRFHDLGDSGWKLILLVVPLLNTILVFYLLLAKGKDEPNKYGEAPLKSVNILDDIFNKNQNLPDVKIRDNRYCSNCGNQIDTDSIFCSNCGAKAIIFK